MSAKYNPRDSFIYFPYNDKLTKLEETQINFQFDMQCDLDENEIKELKKEIKFLKRVCIYKILMSPLEWGLTLLLFGFQEASYKKKTTSLYWKFFRNKITIEKFGKQITELMKSGKVL